MKAEFTTYLKSVGMTKTYQKRVEEIYEFYIQICPEEITDIFVSEYSKEDGSREYENLWFFSRQYCMEAKHFLIEDDFDLNAMGNRIVYWTIAKQDYDMKKITENSRLTLEFKMDIGLRGLLKASRGNCNYLKDIVFKHVMPNFEGWAKGERQVFLATDNLYELET